MGPKTYFTVRFRPLPEDRD